MTPAPLDALLDRHGRDPGRLVQLLRDVVAAHGYVPPDVVTHVAGALGLSRAHVEGVAGFYAFLGTSPKGRFRLAFSDGVTDRMAGSEALVRRVLDAFHVDLGETSRDGRVTVERTSCTGLCDQGPALLVNGRAIGRLTPARIGAIISLVRGGSPVEAWPENLFVIDRHVHRTDRLLDTPAPPGFAIRAALARGPDDTIAAITASGLRGRGGAGFPTGKKWRWCADAPGPERYVVCNADEGEPGTFKDRELLASYADLVIEGMTVAGLAVGATRGLVYLRAEYPFLVEPLLATIAERRREGWLGELPSGHTFEVELHVGAGAYVCGEESALLESLEGRRGIPRLRPPFPVTHGYKGRPTVVDNVETLAAAAHVVAHGPDWLRAAGTPTSTGTKVLSVSGDVARPGIYEVPFGIAVGDVLAAAGAERTQAVQVGGPSGTLLTARELGRRIAFEDVPCAGAVVAFDDRRDMLEVIDNFAAFFAHESCGFCTPCRVGTTLTHQMTARLAAGVGTRRDLADLGKVADLMRAASHCGLGATAGNPIRDALTKFKPAFERRIVSREVVPSFDLDAALAPAREATGREDARAHLGEET